MLTGMDDRATLSFRAQKFPETMSFNSSGVAGLKCAHG